MLDLYETYQDYQFAKKMQEVRICAPPPNDNTLQFNRHCDPQARLPVIDQRRKWKKHIADYIASLDAPDDHVRLTMSRKIIN